MRPGKDLGAIAFCDFRQGNKRVKEKARSNQFMRSSLEIMQSEIKSNGTKREAKGNIKKCSKMYSHKSSQM